METTNDKKQKGGVSQLPLKVLLKSKERGNPRANENAMQVVKDEDIHSDGSKFDEQLCERKIQKLLLKFLRCKRGFNS